MNEQLKPCPFCGSVNISVDAYDPFDGYQGNLTTYIVHCRNCGCTLSHESKNVVMNRWNCRVDDDSKPHHAQILNTFLGDSEV